MSRSPVEAPRPKAVVHVDLDGAPHIFAHHGWAYTHADDPIFESGMNNLLAFLEAMNTRATLFAIASDLEDPRKVPILARAVAAGHEIASHGLTHCDLDTLSFEDKRRELAESRERLERVLGTPVRGFRAPNWRIDRDTLELLDECGYAWDSSLSPDWSAARKIGAPSVLDRPYRPLYDAPTFELPVPSQRPLPFHPSYSLLLGQRYFSARLARFERRGVPLVLLFHLTDFADPLAAERLVGAKSRVFTLSHLSAAAKRRRCTRMLERVQRGFDITDSETLLEAYPVEREGKRVSLGISTTHETGAAVFRGNECLASISEERLDRVKFSTQYPPTRSTREAIRVAGIDPREITDVVIGGQPPGRLLASTLRGQLADTFDFHGWNDYFPHFNKVLYRGFAWLRSLTYRRIGGFLEREYGIRPQIHYVAHHLCHAAAAYRTAPFDDTLVVTSDGVGDDISLTISEGRNGRLRLLKMLRYPHSFGQFYTACTQVLGFRGGRHEGKITGLSGFGQRDESLLRKVRSTIKRSGNGEFALDKRYYAEGFVRGFSLAKLRRGESLFDALQYRNYKAPLARLLEGHTREDVARVFQDLLEEELIRLVRPFAEQTGCRNLALSGGVFANVKANAALFRSIGFERVFIYPHMGDGGLGPGAVLELLQARPEPFFDVYWGPGFDEKQMEAALRAAAPEGLQYRRESNVEKVVAELLSEKNVVARFNGRMEYGPRALGNRSILYSASEPEANTWLNQRLGRTEFMPFAPVAMREHADKLFKDIEGTEHACNFMTIILDCTDWTKEHCPAIVHVDGTARPQLVDASTNESMHKILEYYDALTGIPLIVNTSFNMHEEPIVCSPEDAVRAYLDSRLNYLAIGPFIAWIDEKAEA